MQYTDPNAVYLKVYVGFTKRQYFRFHEGYGLEMAPGNKPTVIRFNSVQSINKFGEYGDMCWPN